MAEETPHKHEERSGSQKRYSNGVSEAYVARRSRTIPTEVLARAALVALKSDDPRKLVMFIQLGAWQGI